jgi:hypothetical protein
MDNSIFIQRYEQFNPGEKVRTRYGEIRMVLRQDGCMVLLEEESCGWHHPSNLFRIEDSEECSS